MKIAVISDIHANLEALRSVLKDIKDRGITRVYCAGDLVGYAPFPNEVIEIIKEKQIPTVMGNYDDGVGNMRLICGCDYADEKAQLLGEKSIAWTKEHTTEENKEFLRALPHEIKFTCGKYKFLIVHGSPRKLNEYLKEDTPAGYLEELLDESVVDVIICGHTHKAYHKVTGHRHVINAGSVGKPKHGNPQSTYVIIDCTQELKVETVEVNYNFEITAMAIENSSLPDDFAELIRKG